MMAPSTNDAPAAVIIFSIVRTPGTLTALQSTQTGGFDVPRIDRANGVANYEASHGGTIERKSAACAKIGVVHASHADGFGSRPAFSAPPFIEVRTIMPRRVAVRARALPMEPAETIANAVIVTLYAAR